MDFGEFTLPGTDGELDLTPYGLATWNSSGMAFGQMGDYGAWASQARAQERAFKAMTASAGIVAAGATGGQALKVQYLHDAIENTSFEMDDCVLMKWIKKTKAYGPTVEWTTSDFPGGGGDGFTDESGNDGAFNIDYSDDNFRRQTENIKFMAEGRQVSLVVQHSRLIAGQDAMGIEKELATRALLYKAELAAYFGNSGMNFSSFNGMEAQITNVLQYRPDAQDILFDAGGNPIDKAMLELTAILNRNKFGKADRLLLSTTAHGDSNILLFPEVRDQEGSNGKRYGTFKDEFLGPNGVIKLMNSPMLRPGRPLRPDGPGSDGKPRLNLAPGQTAGGLAGYDALCANFASTTPFTSVAAGAAGSVNWWNVANQNTNSAALAAAPGLPNSLAGNSTNRNAAGNYYYAVAPVFRGREGALFIFGAGLQTTRAISGSPTSTTLTAGQIMTLTFDNTTPALANLGTTYARQNVYYRIYRLIGASTP